jgi:hypothetical protein
MVGFTATGSLSIFASSRPHVTAACTNRHGNAVDVDARLPPSRSSRTAPSDSLVKWKNCRDSSRCSNFDGAAYVVVNSIRDDPTAKSKIEDNSRRRRKRTIT